MRIEKGMIVSLKRFRPGETPPVEGALLDFSSSTIAPGLVDCHVHLTWSGTVDQYVRQSQLTLTFEQSRARMAQRLEKHLARGIVALRDGGDSAGHTLRFRDECLEAQNLPIHLKAAGKAWRAKGRYGRILGGAPPEGLTLADCIAGRDPRMSEKAARRPDHIKIINSGLNSLSELGKETKPQFSPEDLDSAVAAARRQGLTTMTHANGKLPVKYAIDARCASIEHGFFMGRENIERMAELQIFWAPTAFSMKAYSEHLAPGSIEADISSKNLEHQIEQIGYARTAGAPVVVGTDSGGMGLYHGKSFVEELKLLMAGGFSVEESMRCATFEGARLLGLEREVGRLAVGMPATFVVVRGLPAGMPDSLRIPEAVYVRGVEVALSNREESS